MQIIAILDPKQLSKAFLEIGSKIGHMFEPLSKNIFQQRLNRVEDLSIKLFINIQNPHLVVHMIIHFLSKRETRNSFLLN